MLHIAAATQIRLDTAGRAYYRRKLAAGKARMEAMRCLKRRISDAVYRQLVADAQATTAHTAAAETVSTGPEGHSGATLISSAADQTPAHRHFGVTCMFMAVCGRTLLPDVALSDHRRIRSASSGHTWGRHAGG
jgi:hypothetical protein